MKSISGIGLFLNDSHFMNFFDCFYSNAVSRLTKTGGNLQGQVQQELQNQASQHPAGAGFFRELASNMFSHGSHSGQHGDIVNVHS